MHGQTSAEAKSEEDAHNTPQAFHSQGNQDLYRAVVVAVKQQYTQSKYIVQSS